MPAYCEVALPVPLDRAFTYAVREGQLPQRGARVIVPFRKEKLIGVVTGLNAKAPPDLEIRFLEAVLDEEPLLSDSLLSLAEWMAQYYLAPLGEVLRGMLPLMAEVRRTVYYRITGLGRDVLAGSMDGDSANSQVRKSGPFDKLRAGSGAPSFAHKGTSKRRGKLSAEEQDLEHRVLIRLAAGEPVKVSTLRTATAATLPVLAGLARKKWIVRETAAAERDARRMERFAVLVPEARLPALTQKQQAILAELAACGNELPLAELRRKELPSSTLQTLVRRGLVRIDERPAVFRLGGLRPTASPFLLNETADRCACQPGNGSRELPSLSTSRSDWFRQNGRLPCRHAARARPRSLVHPAGSRDRPHAADGRPARPSLRPKSRVAPFRAHA